MKVALLPVKACGETGGTAAAAVRGASATVAVLVELLGIPSWSTLVVTVKLPSSAYVWSPETVRVLPSSVMAALEALPSPQSIVAV
ncbi:hypothetical protein [Terrabacter sp. Root181]|uniref:hypothetical protein n=1 Tax=Terrabacter sp. Root181 TaxID=1736484 RepID=UPI0012FBEC11|nr:hypothetical protein [Terrabacter sp. Root181]